MRSLLTLCALSLLLAAGLLAGCGDDEAGAPCVSNADCDALCATGGDYPGGLCTYHCSVSNQCPSGWACIDKSGGICLGTCPNSAWCRDQFGPGWACKDKDLLGEPGKAPVCTGE